MRLDTLKYFYEHSVHQNPSFYYRGPFLDKFTSVLVDMSRSSTKNETAEGAISKKTSFILVECFQNILKHSEVVDDPERTKPIEGMFSFKYMHGAFVVNSINVISNSDKPLFTVEDNMMKDIFLVSLIF